MSGTDSSLQQVGAVTTTVGHSSVGQALLRVESSGSVMTGTGLTTVNATGTLEIDNATFTLGGDLTIDGGELRRDNAGVLELATGSNVHVTNGGQLNLNDSFFIVGDGETITVDAGGSFTSVGPTSFGSGGASTFIVDGPTSSASIGGFPGWGSNGGNAHVIFRVGAQVDLSSVGIGGVGVSTALVEVESDADLSVSSALWLGNSGDTGGSATLTITGPGSTVTSTSASPTRVGQASGATGTLNVETGATFTKNTGQVTLFETGTINLTGGTIDLGESIINEGGTFNFSSGQLDLNDPDAKLLVSIEGIAVDTLNLNTPDISGGQTLNTPGDAIVLPGGTLTVSGGSLAVRNLTVATGGEFLYESGSFTGSGPLQTALGSTVDIDVVSATLGDSSSLAGVVIGGALDVGTSSVTLEDANDVAFDTGALVTLGNGISAGTIIANNGLTLDFGGNIAGYGTLNTPDNTATPVINNGHITGNSMGQKITLPGYVKGVGTCDFCDITGTDAPGLSTAAVNRGSVSYNGTLEIEIGGTAAGGEFDQLNHILNLGIADLGGTLEVQLIDGFVPSAGDMFEIITATSVIDTFDTLLLPSLPGDLLWFVNYDATSVNLVSTYAGDFDEDGDVDDDDLVAWEGGFGSAPAVHMTGDANADVLAGGFDFLVWQRQFGMVGGAPAVAAVVPEPSGMVLCVMGLMIWAMRRSGDGF